ncbi:MAG: hypothetical protein Q9214_002012 [Letrouitia sp. 1 TL-2023]
MVYLDYPAVPNQLLVSRATTGTPWANIERHGPPLPGPDLRHNADSHSRAVGLTGPAHIFSGIGCSSCRNN